MTISIRYKMAIIFILINFRAVIKGHRFLPKAIINKLASFVLAIYILTLITEALFKKRFQLAYLLSVVHIN